MELETLPKEVQEILLNHNEEKNLYKENDNLIKKLNNVGWTCDYDLSGEIYDIKKLT